MILLIGLGIGFAFLSLENDYGYKPESLADLWYNLRTPPTYYYFEQGLEYRQAPNGMILRTDKVVYDEKVYYYETFGIPTWAGIYYVQPQYVQVDKTSHRSYVYDENQNLIEIVETHDEVFYTNINGHHIIKCFSDLPVTDNSGNETICYDDKEKITGYKAIYYAFPTELTQDYCFNIGDNYYITGSAFLWRDQVREMAEANESCKTGD